MDRLSAPEQNRILAGLSNLLRRVEQDSGPEFLPRGLDVMGLVRQLALPSAETVEKLSYGDPLFRMPTQSNIPITTDRGYVAEVLGMAPAVPAASRATTRISNEMADQLVRAITGNPQATAPGVLEAAGQMAPLARMFKPEEVKKVIPETKVVDESGDPIVMYHGTQRAPTGIDEFGSESGYAGQETAGISWFTSSPESASGYANWVEGAGNPTVYPVYLSIKNPASIEDYLKAVDEINKSVKGRNFVDNDPEIGMYDKRVVEKLKDKGFDGVSWTDAEYTGQTGFATDKDVTALPFSSKQIKSAVSDPAFAGLLEPEAANFEMPSFARAIPETSEEIDRIYDYLEDQAKKAGFKVKGGSSNVSGSRYLTIVEDLPDDDVRDIQVRISNHGDRHPFTEASEGKISIDPSMGGTDLEQTLYQLQDKGFNLIK
jgi:hypothetical protein